MRPEWGRLAHGAGRTRRSGARSVGVSVEEREDALPRVGRGVGELLVLSVEETVRCAVENDDLVLDAGVRQGALEGVVVLCGDVRVVTRLEGEDRRLELVGSLRRPGLAVPQPRHAVEAHGAGEAVPARGGQPRVPAAEAEADREDGG